jgi:hypothetical protein
LRNRELKTFTFEAHDKGKFQFLYCIENMISCLILISSVPILHLKYCHHTSFHKKVETQTIYPGANDFTIDLLIKCNTRFIWTDYIHWIVQNIIHVKSCSSIRCSQYEKASSIACIERIFPLVCFAGSSVTSTFIGLVQYRTEFIHS